VIANRDSLAKSPVHELALDFIKAAIDAVQPERVTETMVSLEHGILTIEETSYNLEKYNEVVIVGGGKAAGGVTQALESILEQYRTNGLVVTKQRSSLSEVRCIVGSHPLPTDQNTQAERVIESITGF